MRVPRLPEPHAGMASSRPNDPIRPASIVTVSSLRPSQISAGDPTDVNAYVVLRIAQVVVATSLSRATIYRLCRAGDFPRAVRLSRGRVAWRQAEVAAWLKCR